MLAMIAVLSLASFAGPQGGSGTLDSGPSEPPQGCKSPSVSDTQVKSGYTPSLGVDQAASGDTPTAVSVDHK